MSSKSISAPYKKITPGYMLVIILSTFAFSFIYYGIALIFNENPMIMFDYVVFTCVLAVVVTGGYQIFFWVQNNNYFFKTKCLVTKLDNIIPFWPSWVWPYSFIYYIMIGMVVIEINSLADGLYHVFGGLLVLLPSIGIWSFIFIAVIAVSSVLVKQHTVLDIVPGLLLGWGIHTLVTI